MLKEIYCRIPSDVNYKEQIECDNEIETILQQIRVILGTVPGQVLGSETFGIDLEQFLFQYGVDTDTIKSTLNDLIIKYLVIDQNKYTVTVDVNYGQDRYNKSDYAVIDININQSKMMGILVT